MLNSVILLRVFSFLSLFYVFLIDSAYSQGFSKVVTESGDAPDYRIHAVIAVIVLLTFILFLYKKKYVYFSFSKHDFLNTKKQSDDIIDAFDRLIKAIESRDVKLRDDYKTILSVNDSKTDFLLDVSHEIRTPMHAILNFADIGQKKIDSGDNDLEKLKSYFSRVEESGFRLLNLINSILDLTVMESGKVSLSFEEGCIVECVDDVIKDLNSLIEKKNINVVISKSDTSIRCFIDKPHITRVMVNLLSNSIKFSPNGGKVNIDIREIAEDDRIEGSGILFSIEDEGVGVPEDELDVIFNKFIQSSAANTENVGSGLGLAICKEVIGLHNGVIWAENNSQKGAKFSFIIPIKEHK